MPQKKTKVIREIPENPFIQGQAKRKKLRVAAYCRVSTEQEEQAGKIIQARSNYKIELFPQVK